MKKTTQQSMKMHTHTNSYQPKSVLQISLGKNSLIFIFFFLLVFLSFLLSWFICCFGFRFWFRGRWCVVTIIRIIIAEIVHFVDFFQECFVFLHPFVYFILCHLQIVFQSLAVHFCGLCAHFYFAVLSVEKSKFLLVQGLLL